MHLSQHELLQDEQQPFLFLIICIIANITSIAIITIITQSIKENVSVKLSPHKIIHIDRKEQIQATAH